MTGRWWWAAAAVAAFVGAMALQSVVWDENGGIARGLCIYWAAYALLWGVLGWVVWRNRTNPRLAWAVVLTVAAAARVAVALTTTPLLSDDIWRYIFDGQTLGVDGRNPYVLSPAEAGSEMPINNPELVTIYQPTSQWVFAGLARLGGDAAATFRLGFGAFDMAVVVLLLLALRRAGRSPWWALLYAWHPLALSETAGSGHQDAVGIAFMVGALYAAQIANARGALAAGVCLALAAGVKPVVLPLLLPMAWPMRKDLARLIGLGAGFVAVLVLLYLPFALMDGGLTGMIETGRTFVEKWAANATVHPAIRFVVEAQYGEEAGKLTADLICAAAMLGVLIGAMLLRCSLWATAAAYLLAALLLSSTVHPWYLLWALALLPMAFSLTGWVFSLTIVTAYAAWLNPARFQPPLWVVLMEYVPVYLAVAWDLTARARACWAARP